ncbi:hypothetical protein ACSLBF_10445 [Pseudoalteromonas sp. T1lg65]|uniref:hypothetical protein n=1 Tax=Pseudoalteromonas sp. T1lg65 TaxID=2077101 RepID=UPI003F79EE63
MTPSKAAFSTGAISTTLIGLLKLLETSQIIDALTGEVLILVLPLAVSLFVWTVNRALLRVEPYTDEQLKERSRCRNTIKELKKELEDNPPSNVKQTIESQLNKQYEKLSSISLKQAK